MEENTERPSYEPELTEPPSPSTATAQYSPLQRLWQVFIAPGEVFKDIGIKPSWILIMVISLVMAFVAQSLIVGHIDTEATSGPTCRPRHGVDRCLGRGVRRTVREIQ